MTLHWRRQEGQFSDVETEVWFNFKKEAPDYIVKALSNSEGHMIEGIDAYGSDGYRYTTKTIIVSKTSKPLQLVERRQITDAITQTAESDEEIAHQSVAAAASRAPSQQATLQTKASSAQQTTLLPFAQPKQLSDKDVKKPAYVDLLLSQADSAKQPMLVIEKAKVTALLMLNDSIEALIKENRAIAQAMREYVDYINRFGFK